MRSIPTYRRVEYTLLLRNEEPAVINYGKCTQDGVWYGTAENVEQQQETRLPELFLKQNFCAFPLVN